MDLPCCPALRPPGGGEPGLPGLEAVAMECRAGGKRCEPGKRPPPSKAPAPRPAPGKGRCERS